MNYIPKNDIFHKIVGNLLNNFPNPVFFNENPSFYIKIQKQ
jgi:hypothetical protein